MELYWIPDQDWMLPVTNEKDVDKAQCYYHALDVEKLEAELAQVKADLATALEGVAVIVRAMESVSMTGRWSGYTKSEEKILKDINEIGVRILTQKEEGK